MNNAVRISAASAASGSATWLARRIAAVWVSAWIGMILLIGVLTISLAGSWQGVAAASPEGYRKAVALAGEPLMRELMKFQAAESSRAMLESWGWAQLGVGAGLFGFLLLFSSAGKTQLGLTLAMLLDAALIKFALIPNVDQFSRQKVTAETSQRLAEMNSRYQLANTSFLVSQSVTLALAAILLVLLLRRSRRASQF